MKMRVRDVMEAANGDLFVLKDGEDGGLLRLTPHEKDAQR
jgi:glucose/arabinose dehydrogenase